MPGLKRRWYTFIPGDDPELATSYIYSPATPTCLTGSVLCSIYAVFTGTNPINFFTPNMESYIVAALTTGVPQPQNPPFQKFYVYMKNIPS